MTNNNSCCKALVDKVPLLCDFCSSNLKESIEQNKSCVMYGKGQIIFYEGGPVTGVFFVYSGKVKVWKHSVHGHEQIVRLSKDGDILGYRGCIEKTNYALSATALEDSHICFIEKDIFLKSLKSNPELHLNILLYYIKELRNIERMLRNMTEMNVREKVAETLLIIKNAYGKELQGKATLGVKLLRQDIASIACISTDRLIKQLSEFKKEKMIAEKSKNITILNLKGLEEIVALYE